MCGELSAFCRSSVAQHDKCTVHFRKKKEKKKQKQPKKALLEQMHLPSPPYSLMHSQHSWVTWELDLFFFFFMPYSTLALHQTTKLGRASTNFSAKAIKEVFYHRVGSLDGGYFCIRLSCPPMSRQKTADCNFGRWSDGGEG